MEEIFNSWLVKQKIAHRGLHDEVSPENSLSAFKKAVEKGYAIETDVQMTADGILLAFHDETLDRMTYGKGLISQKNFNEICNYTLKNSEEKIPLLSEVLSLVGGKVPLLIEIKSHKNIKAEEEVFTCHHTGYGAFHAMDVNGYYEYNGKRREHTLSCYATVKIAATADCEVRRFSQQGIWCGKNQPLMTVLANKKFHASNCKSFANLRRENKMKRAKELLLKHKVKVVAKELDYSGSQVFSRAFKTFFKISST